MTSEVILRGIDYRSIVIQLILKKFMPLLEAIYSFLIYSGALIVLHILLKSGRDTAG